MTTIAALREAYAALTQAANDRPPAPAPFVPELPPAPAPHGPGAARHVAQQLADTGAHSHLVADGQTVCLSGGCDRPRTPAEVLL